MGGNASDAEYRFRKRSGGDSGADILGELGQDCEFVDLLRDLRVDFAGTGYDAGEIWVLGVPCDGGSGRIFGSRLRVAQ